LSKKKVLGRNRRRVGGDEMIGVGAAMGDGGDTAEKNFCCNVAHGDGSDEIADDVFSFLFNIRSLLFSFLFPGRFSLLVNLVQP
jgi:hypothetical protein